MSSGPAVADRGTSSYREILHSTALVGASSVVAMFFSLIRMKMFALLLGPSGLGAVSLLTSMIDVVVAVVGLGIGQSGIRQIAKAQGEGNLARMAGTISTVQRASLALGTAGGILLAALAMPISLVTFSSTDYVAALVLLGLAVLFRILMAGETALLQGTRRILELAKVNIITSVAAVVVAAPMLWFWREGAIAPLLVVSALAGWLAARWYSREVPHARKSAQGAPGELGELLRLGVAFTVSGFLTMGAAYAVRMIVLQSQGLEAAGFYQAAWAVAGLYVGVVLQSMGTDFYPRLTAAVADDVAVSRLVNEQTQVSLLLAGPGVIATMTCSHLLVTVFYSPEFGPAASLLRWLSLGMMLRVLTWPMGFIIVAKGWQKIFIATEVAATVIHVGLSAALVPVLGIDGAGMAFFCLYVCHGVIVYVIVRRACGYAVSIENRLMVVFFGVCCASSFAAFVYLPFWWATLVGFALTSITGLFSLFALLRLVPPGSLPKPVRWVLSSVGVGA